MTRAQPNDIVRHGFALLRRGRCRRRCIGSHVDVVHTLPIIRSMHGGASQINLSTAVGSNCRRFAPTTFSLSEAPIRLRERARVHSSVVEYNGVAFAVGDLLVASDPRSPSQAPASESALLIENSSACRGDLP
jgi:hypothetical protein